MITKSEAFERLWNNLASNRRFELLANLGLDYKITRIEHRYFHQMPVARQLDILHTASRYGMA
jgi:2-keto-3-deoxy-L-rhamnonate aldolase RhmA